jgi:hypothetical protein
VTEYVCSVNIMGNGSVKVSICGEDPIIEKNPGGFDVVIDHKSPPLRIGKESEKEVIENIDVFIGTCIEKVKLIVSPGGTLTDGEVLLIVKGGKQGMGLV